MQCPKCNCDTVPIGGVVTYRLRKQIGTIATARRCMGCGFQWCIDKNGTVYSWLHDDMSYLGWTGELQAMDIGVMLVFEETEL